MRVCGRGFLCTALFILGACGQDSAAFRVANGADPSSLDPHLISSVAEGRVLSSLWAGLTRSDPTTLEVLPGLAKSWESSPDGTAWTFHLRKNLYWSDGSSLTASDVESSWLRLQNPATGAPYQDWLAGARFSSHLDEVRIQFPAPRPQFPAMCSWPALAPIPQDLRDGTGTPASVSSGPYTLERWKIRDRVRVVRNPFHWDSSHAGPESIDFLTVESAFTALNLFLTGGVDWTPRVPRLAARNLARNHHPDFRSSPRLGTSFLRFQVGTPPMNDPTVRKAFSDSIHRGQLAELLSPGPVPALSLVPPGLPGYSPPIPGFLLGFPGPELEGPYELLFPSSDSNRLVAEFLQDQWKRNLGVEVRLVNQEWKAFLRSQRKGDYQISLSSWIADYPDPVAFLEVFRSSSGNNRTGWKNQEFDGLLDRAGRAGDPATRNALLQKAETLLMGNRPIAPLLHEAGSDLVSPRWEGVEPGPMGTVDWGRVRPATVAG